GSLSLASNRASAIARSADRSAATGIAIAASTTVLQRNRVGFGAGRVGLRLMRDGAGNGGEPRQTGIADYTGAIQRRRDGVRAESGQGRDGPLTGRLSPVPAGWSLPYDGWSPATVKFSTKSF